MMRFIPKISAQAHCDVPCGIYTPAPAKIAAKTVLRMTEQLEKLKMPENLLDKTTFLQYSNAVSRRIAVKERHAQLCKKELSILWSDFFKEPHLEKYPNLHGLFWRAEKLCSKNKQEVNTEAARELVDTVDEVARIFYEVKNVAERYQSYKEITDKLY